MLPLTIAVTGGIGAGKSTVSAGFGARGAVVMDSDLLAREVVAPGSAGLAAVMDAFGAGVLTPDGSLDRPALGAIVFGDAEARRRLEGITHPLVRATFAARLAQAPADAVVVNDIPLLRTPAEAARYHLVIGVGVADPAERLRRLVGRGHTEQDARRRISAQIGDDERRTLSDHWLDNSAAAAALEQHLDLLWRRLLVFADNRRDRRPAEPIGDGPPADAGPLPARVSLALAGAAVIRIGDDGEPPTGLVARDVPLDPAAGTAALAEIGFPEAPGAVNSPTGRLYGNADPGRPLTLSAAFSG